MADPTLTDEELAEIETGHMRYSPTCVRLIAALRASRAEVERLRTALDEAQLRSIEARNPGIDIDDVRRLRTSQYRVVDL